MIRFIIKVFFANLVIIAALYGGFCFTEKLEAEGRSIKDIAVTAIQKINRTIGKVKEQVSVSGNSRTSSLKTHEQQPSLDAGVIDLENSTSFNSSMILPEDCKDRDNKIEFREIMDRLSRTVNEDLKG